MFLTADAYTICGTEFFLSRRWYFCKEEAAMNIRSESAVRVSRVSILINLLLSAGKLLAGLLAHSGAMVSDAVHSASDVFSTLIVLIGLRLAGRDSDREHPFGHERMESAAALILAVVLLVTGLFIGYGSLRKILAGGDALVVPGVPALIAAIVSILVKEGMFRYTRRYARALNSSALMADAWHHRSDALSSVGALIGVAGARMGLPILDPLAGLVICVFILKAAFDIFRDALDKMVDRSCGEETEAAICRCAAKHAGVSRVDLIRSREFGDRIASLVVSESDEFEAGVSEEDSWHYRKRVAIHRLKAASHDAKIVAIGDKLSNMRAIARDYAVQGDALWNIFHAKDPKDHEWHYRGLADALSELSDTFAYKEFVQLIDQVFKK